MSNFVFLSPHFPENYRYFCVALKQRGVNVLGIGDAPYDQLAPDLKGALTEYYRVGSLENWDEVYRACAYFIFRYGRIDWLESNNEYWLGLDAALRTAFAIPSGMHREEAYRVQHKSQMKEFYRQAGIPAARWTLLKDRAGALAFLRQAGGTMIAKPDQGVGAQHTFRISSPEELDQFLAVRPADRAFILEEYVSGTVCSYDAIIDSHSRPLFETGNWTPGSIMDLVNQQTSCTYCILKELSDDVRAAGRAVVAAIGVKSRFVHLEFFRLDRDQPVGNNGALAGLEVNLRPSGAYSPEMMNFANSTDVYRIWADMVVWDENREPRGEAYYCAFAGRRDSRRYQLNDRTIVERFGPQLKMTGRLPAALARDMGDTFYIANFSQKEEMAEFWRQVTAEAGE